jgi:alkylation response protein AidB-like acyl-CoA dehydrogenase
MCAVDAAIALPLGRRAARDRRPLLPFAKETPTVLPTFEPTVLPEETHALRSQVRAFLRGEIEAGHWVPRANSWTISDHDFSRRCGEAGFIGMTWPKQYGGGELSSMHRFVVIEEMLAHGAPVGAHWIADRQSGGQILRFGTEAMRRDILPRICSGQCFFGIGMSEPDVGSDLASVRTRGEKTNAGWRINGTKVWTSGAHRANYLIALVRTEPQSQNRHAGLTQFLIDLSRPGLRISPIENLAKERDFCEVVLEDYEAHDDEVLGEVGHGWKLVTHELAQERSGPERFLSDFNILVELVRKLGPGAPAGKEVGRMVARLFALREMSISVAGMLTRGASPELQAALVKDLGMQFERDLPEEARLLHPMEPSVGTSDPYEQQLARTLLYAPSFSLRGGTREVLRGIITRHMGLR